MKPRVALLLLLASLVGLLVLIKAAPAAPVAAPTLAFTATGIVPTVRPSDTPLPSPSPTRAEPTATELPTDTATPTEAPSPTQPAIHGSVTDYRLADPSADGLLDLYTEAQRQGDLCFSTINNKYWLESDSVSLEKAIVLNLQHFYPQGVPTPQRLLDIQWGQNCGYFVPDPALLTDAAWDYLKDRHWSNSSKLSTPDFDVDINKIELDGDPQPEWLLRVAFVKLPETVWFTVNEAADGQYQRLSSEALPPERTFLSGGTDLTSIEDLTGDGLTDLILVSQSYFGGTTVETARVLRGSAGGFKLMRSLSVASFVLDGDSSIEVEHAATGQPYLHLIHGHDINWGCSWTTEETYSWSGGVEQVMKKGENPPQTPYCAVAKAISFLSKPVDNLTAIQLLEGAVKTFAVTPANQPDYELFVHYRLAVLYALQGQQAAARQHLLWLKNYAATTLAYATTADYRSFVLDSVETELNSAQISPIRLCDAMERHAYLLADRLDYLRIASAIHIYPLDSEPYPPAFCPMDDVLAQALPKSLLPTNTSQEVVFGQVGVKLAYVQPLLLAKGDEAWTMILQLHEPRLVNLVNGQVSPVVHTFKHIVGSLVTLDEDLTGDGLTDRAFAYRLDASYYCQSDNDPYDIVVVVPQADAELKTLASVECAPAGQFLNLHTLLADKDGDGVSDWVQTQLDKPQGQGYVAVRDPAWLAFDTQLGLKPNENELNGLRQVDDAFYKTPTSVQTRALLQQALAAIPTADPNAPRVQQHFQYLLALSYELDGDTQSAIQGYYDIWANPTHTLWGNLAASHLQHK